MCTGEPFKNPHVLLDPSHYVYMHYVHSKWFYCFTECGMHIKLYCLIGSNTLGSINKGLELAIAAYCVNNFLLAKGELSPHGNPASSLPRTSDFIGSWWK